MWFSRVFIQNARGGRKSLFSTTNWKAGLLQSDLAENDPQHNSIFNTLLKVSVSSITVIYIKETIDASAFTGVNCIFKMNILLHINLYQACIVVIGIFFKVVRKQTVFREQSFVVFKLWNSRLEDIPFVSKMAARHLQLPHWERITFTEFD